MNSYDRKVLDGLRDTIVSYGEKQAKQGEAIRNIYHIVEKMERHQAEANGTVRDLIEKTASNTTSSKRIWSVVISSSGIFFTALCALAGKLLELY